MYKNQSNYKKIYFIKYLIIKKEKNRFLKEKWEK